VLHEDQQASCCLCGEGKSAQRVLR
jgi:hypothetical protein